MNPRFHNTVDPTCYKAAIGSLTGGGSVADPIHVLGRCKVCKAGMRTVAVRCYKAESTGLTSSAFRVTWEGVEILVRGNWSDGVWIECPTCYPVPGAGPLRDMSKSRWTLLRPVLGKLNPEKVCDGRCMGATGPNCECQCGGANHGCNHG